MKNKGVRVVLSLIWSLMTLMLCINLNIGTEREVTDVKAANIVAYVDNSNYLIVKDNITIEINTKLPTIKDYFENYDLNEVGTIKYYVGNKEVNSNEVLNNINTYNVVIIVNNKEYTTYLNVDDTKTPELVVKNITINEGEKYSANSFVTSCKDNSNKECKISFKNEKMGKYTKPGSYVVSITAKDEINNIITKDAKVTIKAKVVNNKTSNKSSETTSNKTTVTKSKYKTTNELKSQAKQGVSNNKKIADEIISYTNTYRREAGANNLKYDESLSVAATIRAIEIAIYDKFDHVRPNGTSFATVLKELGIYYRYAGENIAYGYLDAEEVSVAWKESPGHYKNMISKNYNKIGIGYFEYNNTTYFVQTFSN